MAIAIFPKPSGPFVFGPQINPHDPIARGLISARICTELNPSVSSGYIPPVDLVTGWLTNYVGGTVGPAMDVHGAALHFSAITSAVQLFGPGPPARDYIPTAGVTIAIVRRKTDVTNRISSLFGHLTGSGTQVCQSHCPFVDGDVYWDFGTSRLTYTTYVTSSYLEAWVFVAGSRGMAIYLNGQRVANSGTAVSRTTVTDSFEFNRSFASGGDLQYLYQMLISREQWTPSDVRAWTDNPTCWLMPQAPTRRLWGKAAAGGAGRLPPPVVINQAGHRASYF